MSNWLHLPGVVASYVSTPNHASLQITGDIEFIARLNMSDWSSGGGQAIIIDKRASAVADKYSFNITNKFLRVEWTETGPTSFSKQSTVGVPFSDGTTGWVKATLDVDNGASGNDVKFYTSTDTTNDPAAVSWTQLGTTVTTAGTTNIVSTTANLLVGRHSDTTGFNPFKGRVYRAIVKNGIDGTTVFDADFTNLTPTNLQAGTFTEGTGKTVTLNGNEWTYVRPISGGILSRAQAVWTANDGNQGFSKKWADRSGNAHHAQLGSAAGVDASDPLFLRPDPQQYLYLPGTSGNYASTPDHASFDVTDLDIAFSTSTWRPASEQPLFDRAPSDPNRQWRISMQADGKVKLAWYPTGSGASLIQQSSAVFPFADSQVGWARVTLDVDNGASGYDLKFYHSTDGTNWTQLGSTIVGGAATVLAAVDQVLSFGYPAGANPHRIHRFVWRDSIGGSPIVDADFTNRTALKEPFSTFVEGTGKTVTINRSATSVPSTVVDRPMWVFDGVDDYHRITSSDQLEPTDAWTFVMAMRKETDTATRWYAGVGEYAATPHYSFISDSASNLIVSKLRGDTAETNRTSDAAQPDRTQLVLAQVYTAAHDHTFYIDGVQQGFPQNTDIGTFTSTTDFLAGRSNTVFPVRQQVMGMAIFREALTAAEILAVGRELTGGTGGRLLLLGLG